MNGATTEFCAAINRKPKRTEIITTGINQYFFLCLRNKINSVINSIYAPQNWCLKLS